MAKKQTKAQEALAEAEERLEGNPTWFEFHNSLFGIGGVVSRLFPSQSERTAFCQTEEYRQIQQIILDLQEGNASGTIDASGKFVLRLPRSLHRALIAEAESEGVSLNQLCLAKLSVQLAAAVNPSAK